MIGIAAASNITQMICFVTKFKFIGCNLYLLLNLPLCISNALYQLRLGGMRLITFAIVHYE